MRSVAIAADRQPEFGGMVGEGLLVTGQEFVIAGFGPGSPSLCLLRLAGVTQDAGELGRIIRVVGCERQRPKSRNGRQRLPEGSIEFG
jgi:hypothetical protein